jgi:hypothetical protein
MARTINEIETKFDEAQAAEAGLAGLNSPSQTAIFTLWKYICSLCQLFLEQLIDFKKVEIEEVVKSAPVGSEPWLQAKVFEFQYDSVVPQVLDLVDFAPQYNPVDVTKRIISRCSVKTTAYKTVRVLVAKSEPPVALSGAEKTALQAYLTNGGDGTFVNRGRALGFAGVTYLADSFNPDRLYLRGSVYYNGQYSSTIQASVITAINAYMAKLPFVDGSLSLLGISDAIQGALGVSDILMADIAVRADSTSFGSKTYLRQNQLDIITIYPTYAGYIVEEDTVGETFSDQLTFIAL